MHYLVSLTFAAVATLPAIAQDITWGGAWYFGPSSSTIYKTSTTAVLGQAPFPQPGQLYVWPGLSNSSGDLVQACMDSVQPEYCGTKRGEWCAETSYLDVLQNAGQINGKAVPISGSIPVVFDYSLKKGRNDWLQTIKDARNGKTLSKPVSPSGPYMRGFGIGNECQNGCAKTVSPQMWTNTQIWLREADPNFGNTFGFTDGVIASEVVMHDGGLRWTVDRIVVPADNPAGNPQQKKKRAAINWSGGAAQVE